MRVTGGSARQGVSRHVYSDPAFHSAGMSSHVLRLFADLRQNYLVVANKIHGGLLSPGMELMERVIMSMPLCAFAVNTGPTASTRHNPEG